MPAFPPFGGTVTLPTGNVLFADAGFNVMA